MDNNNYVIPYELVFYYPVNEEANKLFGSPLPPGYALAAATSGSAKSALKSSVRSNFEGYYLRKNAASSGKAGPMEDNNVTKVVTIRNQGLRLEVSQFSSENFRYYSGYATYMAVDSEEIQEKVGKKLLIHIIREDFFKLLWRAKNMTNLVLAGTYCFSANTSQDFNLTAHLEDSSDQVLEESKEAGTKMSATKMTSKWIPGHKYVLKKDSKYILYLGEIEEVLTSNEFVWQKRLRNHFFNFSGGSSSYYTGYVEKGTVYLELTQDVIKVVGEYEGKSLPEFIHKCLMTPDGWRSLSSYLWVRDSRAEQKLTGADMGEYMTSSNTYDLNVLVKSICGEVQANTKNLGNLLNYQNDLYMYTSLAPDLVRTNSGLVSKIHDLNKEYLKSNIKSRCDRTWGTPKIGIKDLTLEVVKTQLGFRKDNMFAFIDKFAPFTDKEFDQMVETIITELQEKDGK